MLAQHSHDHRRDDGKTRAQSTVASSRDPGRWQEAAEAGATVGPVHTVCMAHQRGRAIFTEFHWFFFLVARVVKKPWLQRVSLSPTAGSVRGLLENKA